MSDLPISKQITSAEAIELHNRSRRIASSDLLIWTVYQSPSDHPGEFVARPHSSRTPGPYNCHLAAPDLNALRALLPPGLIRFERSPGDDPVIVETWL